MVMVGYERTVSKVVKVMITTQKFQIISVTNSPILNGIRYNIRILVGSKLMRVIADFLFENLMVSLL